MIRLLSAQNGPMRGTELANALEVTTRSIKNYVQEINRLYGKTIISSSRNGYELNNKSTSLLITATDNEMIPQTTEERAFYIIKQLILNHSTQLELLDLCDIFCVSYSTVKSLIAKMNKMFSAYQLEFLCKNDHLSVKGNESSKRKLISYVINEEAKNSYINLDLLQENFANIDIGQLQAIILNTFKQNNYYLNDFAAVNLLLHLLIMIDRKLNGNELDSGPSSFEVDTAHEAAFLASLQHQLEETFEVRFNDFERFELYMLFKANANFSLASSHDDLKRVVGEEVIQLTQELVEKINSLYMIDLASDAFTTPFALHLNNLIFRASANRSISNPMAQAIKHNSPIVFDIAIYIALDLMDKFSITIDEDEAAFLAIHIGAEIERQTANTNKVPAILVCPDYHNLTSDLLNSLMLNFGNQLNIVYSVASENELRKKWTDCTTGIIFTTIPLVDHYPKTDVLSLSPLNLSAQFPAIQKNIAKNMESYKDQKLRVSFHHFFEEELFTADPNFHHSEEFPGLSNPRCR